MQARAEIKYIRISERKLRDLSRNLRGMSAKKALSNLTFTPTKGARLLIKAIESAVANATNTHKMNGDALLISKVEILKGPFFKRWNPVSRGMAHAIKKRTSHIKIVLTDNKKPTLEEKPVKEVKQLPEAKKEPASAEAMARQGKKEVTKNQNKKK